MSIRTTIDIPEDLHQVLRRRAASEKTSIRCLVIHAIEGRYGEGMRKGIRLKGPPVQGKAKPGPLCPDRENPYDVLFS
jgi:hypothetical protein